MTEYIELAVQKSSFNLHVKQPQRGASVVIHQGDDTRVTRNGDTRITRNGDTRIARDIATITPQLLQISKKTFRLLVEAQNG